MESARPSGAGTCGVPAPSRGLWGGEAQVRGPALRLGLRVPEDSVAPRCSRAALTALVPPPSWRPRSCGSNSRLSRDGGSSSTVQARGRGQPPGPRPGQPVPPTMHRAPGTEMHTWQGAGPAEGLGRQLKPCLGFPTRKLDARCPGWPPPDWQDSARTEYSDELSLYSSLDYIHCRILVIK